MKKLLSILLIFIPIILFAQPRYNIIPEPLCWSTGGVDSSITRYTLFSSLSATPRTITHRNASGANVNVIGGTLSQGWCCNCNTNGGTSTADLDSLIRFQILQDSIWEFELVSGVILRDTIREVTVQVGCALPVQNPMLPLDSLIPWRTIVTAQFTGAIDSSQIKVTINGRVPLNGYSARSFNPATNLFSQSLDLRHPQLALERYNGADTIRPYVVEVSYWNGIEYAADHCILERPIVPDSFRLATLADIGGTNLYTGDSSILVSRNINMGQTGKIIFNSNDMGGTTRSILEFETDYSSDDTFVDYLQMKFEDTGIRDSLFLRNVDKGFRIGSGSLLGIYSDSSLVLGQFNVPTILDGAKRATDRNTFKMFPDFTQIQRDAILNPEAGMGITNTTTGKVQLYFNNTWHDIGKGFYYSEIPDTNIVHLWIGGGQSNFDGRVPNSEATVEELAEQTHFKIWNRATQTFENLNIGAGNNQVVAGSGFHGPELGLALYAKEYFPGENIYLAKFAEGGTRIQEHLAPNRLYDTLWNFTVLPAINNLVAQGKTPKISFFWLQGEADANTLADAQVYHLRLDSLITQWRANLGEELPFVAAKIGAANPFQDTINDAYENRQWEFENVALINSEGYPKLDGSHFNYESMKQIALGYISGLFALDNFGVVVNGPLPVKDLLAPLDKTELAEVYQGGITDTLIDLSRNQIFRIDLGAATDTVNIDFSNPVNGQFYTFAWYNNVNNNFIRFPSSFNCNDGNSEGNFDPVNPEAGVLNFYYDGTAYYISSSQPDCIAGFESEYLSILDYMTLNGITEPSDTIKQFQNTLIKQLKSQGVWDQLDVFYVMATEDQRQACINWIDPNRDSIEIIGSPSFTDVRGFTGTDATHDLKSSFIGSPSNNFREFDAGYYWYQADSVLSAGTILQDSFPNDLIVNQNPNDNWIFRFPNDHTGTIVNVNTGWFQLVNDGSLNTNKDLFNNGIDQDVAFSSGGSAIPNDPTIMLGANGVTISIYAMGSAMRDKTVIFNTIIQNYITSIGLVPQ